MAKKTKKSSPASKHEAHKVEAKENSKKIDLSLSQFIPKDSNAWLNAGIFVLIGLIVGLVIMYSAGLAQGATSVDDSCEVSDLSEIELQNKVTSYLNENLVVEGMVASITDVNQIDSGLFEMNFEIMQDGQLVGADIIYATENNLILPRAPAFNLNEDLKIIDEETNETVEVQKSDVPNAELFVWSYCPYGVTALTPFAEVADVVGDKTEMKVYLYYAGHGAYEEQQNKIQACIQEIDKENYWEYAKIFANQIYSTCGSTGDISCDLNESVKTMDLLGIDSEKVLECVENEGDALLEEHYAKAQSLGVTGSPTLVVNNTKITNVSRTADGFLGAICNSFNTAPEECSVELSDDTAVTSGSC